MSSGVSRRSVLLAWGGGRVGGALGAAGGLLAAGGVQGAEPLCRDGAPPAVLPPPERPPLVQSWLVDGRQDGSSPDCSGLRTRDFELLVRVAGSYLAPGELDGQLLRFGSVSKLRGAQYWSFTDRRRQELIHEAFAVDAPDERRPRADFTLAELKSGAELYFVQIDNRSSSLTPYSLRVLQSGAERFRLRIENAADITVFGMTLLARQDMQWVVTVERLAPGRWGWHSLLGVRRLRLGRAEQHRLSNMSRSVALFDVLAGSQTAIEVYR